MARLDRLLALFVQFMAVPALLMVAFARPASGAASAWAAVSSPTPTPTPDVRSWPPDLTPYARPIVPGDWTPVAIPGPVMTPTLTRTPGVRDRPPTNTPDVRSWPPDLTPYLRPIVPGERTPFFRRTPCARSALDACGCRSLPLPRSAMP